MFFADIILLLLIVLGICLLSVVLIAVVVVWVRKQIRVLKREIKLLTDNEKKLITQTCVSLQNNVKNNASVHEPKRRKEKVLPYQNVDSLDEHSEAHDYAEIAEQPMKDRSY